MRKAIVYWQGHLARTRIPLNALTKWSDINKDDYKWLKKNLWERFEKFQTRHHQRVYRAF
ncbi:hypothetical protein OROHE_018291 [Orobanche hederae]